MYAMGEVGGIDLLAACIWTARADRFIDVSYADLAERVIAGVEYLEGVLSIEDFALCKEKAQSWAPKSSVAKTETDAEIERLD